VDLDEGEIATIAGAGCAVAHCPIANARLGHGVAPYLEMRAAGVTVGLGTDSVGSNNRLDLLEEARIASVLHRGRVRRPDVLPAADLLRLCTIDGALALGLADRVGTLEPGKDADLCAVSLDGPHTAPAPDPIATLFHAARGSDVVFTAVRGRVLYDGGRVRGIDANAARRGVEGAAERILEFRQP
ncbi:MAG TPA: amidohydrolase family protein, partial [Longimicrobiaceae bacterium]|nr:amidohydrolase family protein [Longimicrobiaceae bacterium]